MSKISSHPQNTFVLFGSTYPQAIKQQLTDTAELLGYKVLPADIGAFKSGERFCELYPSMQQQFAENKRDIEGARVQILISMDNDPSEMMVDCINIAETVAEYGGIPEMIISFAPFARQDRAFDKRMTSIMGKTFPKHLKCAGVTKVTTFDMHSKASEKFYIDAFGEENVHFLSALDEIHRAVREITHDSPQTKYAAPDGFSKQHDVAQTKARRLTRMDFGEDCILAEHMLGLEKVHTGPSTVEVTKASGDANGCDIVLIDDMGDTLGTAEKAALVTKQDGANSTIISFTHAVLSDNSLDIMTRDTVKDYKNPVDTFVFTDSILSAHEKFDRLSDQQKERVRIISMAPLLKHALTLSA